MCITLPTYNFLISAFLNSFIVFLLLIIVFIKYTNSHNNFSLEDTKNTLALPTLFPVSSILKMHIRLVFYL